MSMKNDLKLYMKSYIRFKSFMAATGMHFLGIKNSRMLDSCAFQKTFTSYN